MKILVTGATGLVGSRLCEELLLKGHEVVALTRNKFKALEQVKLPIQWYEWQTPQEEIPSAALHGLDGVINLMGENIGEGRWTQSKKKKIFDSRITATKTLAHAIKKNSTQLKFYLGASAIGIYGISKQDELFNESSAKGNDYLSSICEEWEKAHHEVSASRKVIARIGVVLANNGGMLDKLIPVYRMGAGGKLGSGKQWMSWIHRDDLVHSMIFALENEKFEGVYNAVSPNPIQNLTFNKELSFATDRPALFPVPPFMLKLVMGEAAALALNSQRVKNEKLTNLNFKFQFADLKTALREICAHKMLPPGTSENFHYVIRKIHFIPKTVQAIFPFFSDAKNLEAMTPDLLRFKILSQSTPKIQEGTIFQYKLQVNGIPMKWKTRITEWKTNEKFVDYQETGPYHVWYHEHKFVEASNGTYMIDQVHYRLPLGPLGDLVKLLKVQKDISKIFSYRSQVIEGLLEKFSSR